MLLNHDSGHGPNRPEHDRFVWGFFKNNYFKPQTCVRAETPLEQSSIQIMNFNSSAIKCERNEENKPKIF